MTEDDAQRTVDAWRRANQWAVRYWQELEAGYMCAMRNKNKQIESGRITYLYDGQHLWYALPSGRILCYPFAKIEEDGVSYAKAAWKPAADAKEWPRARLWRGLACENITQAAANDVLRLALRAVEPLGVILHVHDEIVIETDQPEIVTEQLRRVMCTSPAWAPDLPLDAEIHTMARYGK
jgi:DNA polymerase